MTTTELYHPTSTELKARGILNAARGTNWSSAQQVVINAFSAMYHAALPVNRVCDIANALGNCNFGEERIQEVLTDLVRRRVLRSRRISFKGERITHYEVNY